MAFLKGEKQKQVNTVFTRAALLGGSFHSKPTYISSKLYAELEKVGFLQRVYQITVPG